MFQIFTKMEIHKKRLQQHLQQFSAIFRQLFQASFAELVPGCSWLLTGQRILYLTGLVNFVPMHLFN